MEWQAVVLAIQILLLAAGWLLFQRARGDLSVQAAESPILTEVRALQKSVKQLLLEMELAADRQSIRLENGCADAAATLLEIENTLRGAEQRLETYEARLLSIGSDRFGNDEVSSIRSGRATHFDSDTHIVASSPYLEHRVVETSDGAAAIVHDADRSTQPGMDQRDQIFRLADRGENAASIARTTHVSEGEIEMLLRLRTKL